MERPLKQTVGPHSELVLTLVPAQVIIEFTKSVFLVMAFTVIKSKCSRGLILIVSHLLLCLNAWSLVEGAVWGGHNA